MERQLPPFETAKLIEEKLAEASGKPALVLVHSDPNFSGHPSIKIVFNAAHSLLLLYKPELEAELPYLSAFQQGRTCQRVP